MTGERIRYHPSVILEGLAQLALMFFLIFISAAPLMTTVEAYLVIAAVIGAASFLLFLRWRRTTVQLNENEMVVERNTLFKLKKSIPYSKIASINVDRGIINRVFDTSKLKVNVNTRKNATIPEATLVLKRDLAERIREELSRNMHGSEPVIEAETVSVIEIRPLDVLIHGLFSQSTIQTVSGFLLLAFAIWEQITATNNVGSGGGLISLLMFFVLTVFPTIMSMVHYANFKVYRIKDTIYLQHGLISTFKTSFNVSRINAVHVRSTMVSRLLGRSYIEAEVIGLGLGKDTKRPVLCLLKKNDVIDLALKELVPEFIYEREVMRQPEAARKIIAAKAAIYSAVIVLFSAYLTYVVYATTEGMTMTGIERMLINNMFIIIGIVSLVGIALWSRKAYRIKELTIGDDLFTFVNGVMDRRMTTMSYDKVQIVDISKGPLARRYGLAVGSISLLSSAGGVTVSSGYFPEERLNQVHEIVMERLSNGKYDHRKNEV
ncbi:MAG TPA: PH domain-containing protein [Methanomassiliicoccales archaeon]|nr:PH domain-containing protein [Methanomassiliicoccales archaeon]